MNPPVSSSIRVLALCTALIGIAAPARTDWPTGDIPVCEATGNQFITNAVADGAGGAIIGWIDPRNGPGNSALFTQRVDAHGSTMWTADGVYLEQVDFSNLDRTYMIEDGGNGGMIYVWIKNNDVFTQHVDSTGMQDWNPDTLWGFPNPVPVSTNSFNVADARLTGDGAGGVIIVWSDSRLGGNEFDIYAQRVDAGGIPQWTTEGVAICTAARNQLDPHIDADGSGGAFISWTDHRTNLAPDIYAQRIDSSGNDLWAVDGVLVSDGPPGAIQYVRSEILADGTGGAIVAWDVVSTDLWGQAQRLDASGVHRWITGAIDIAPLSSNAGFNVAAPGDGGLISAWVDNRDLPTTGQDLYIMRVDSSGTLVWAADSSGIPLSTAPGHQALPSIELDDAGVTWLVWSERVGGGPSNLYSQHIDPSGTFLGAANGDSLDFNPWAQDAALRRIPGVGVVAAYQDRRNADDDIFVTMLVSSTASAVRPATVPRASLSANWPNPFGPTTRVPYSVETPGPVNLAVYDVGGRRVRTLVHGPVGPGQRFATWDGTNDRGRRVASGVYFVRLSAGATMISRRMTLLR